MAQDMLNAIYNAEEECKQRESQANLDAQKKAEQTKKDVAVLIENAKISAQNEASALFDSVKADGEKLLENARAEAKLQCDAISTVAQKNRKTVIESAVGQFID